MDYEEEAKDFLNQYEVDSMNYQEHLMEYIEQLIPVYYNEQYEEFMQLEKPTTHHAYNHKRYARFWLLYC